MQDVPFVRVVRGTLFEPSKLQQSLDEDTWAGVERKAEERFNMLTAQ
jgi:hypothetical protein